jgi:hypothetical protein
MPEPTIHLSNPMRYLVPIGTAVFAAVMFVTPVMLAGIDNRKVAIGTAALIFCVLWLIRSAWRAPHELTLDQSGADVRRLSGSRHYALSQVSKWWFAIPDGPPTQLPPASNGVLYVVLDDRTRFRAEVTADEASRIAGILVGVTLASPAAA